MISRPFDAYPQELCLRFRLSYETEKGAERASFIRILLPDDEIVEDLSSILTLMARRLIVPAGKTREQYQSGAVCNMFWMVTTSTSPEQP